MISTLLGYQLYGNNLTQSLQRTAAQPVVSQAQAYYNANIGSVKSVSDLVDNYKLLSYATQAFGLSNMTYAKALLTQVLESNLSDSSSVANKLGGSYVAFAKAFNFNSDGTVDSTAQLQTSGQQASTETLFNAAYTGTATETTNYETAMKSVTSLGQLEASPAALDYVLGAYGINPSQGSATLDQTIDSNLSDPTSYVNQQPDSGYLALSQAFNVNSDGTVTTAPEAETSANIASTTQAYMSNVASDSASQTAAATATSYFLSQITSVTSASQLVSDPKLVAYLTTAYQLPSGTSAATIEDALTNNRASPAFANTVAYPGFSALAKAFNFGTDGSAGSVTQFQSTTQQQSTVSLYMQRQTSDTPDAEAATAYYKANIGGVGSVADLEKNPKLLNYVTTAYGIAAGTSASTLASVIENTNNIAGTTPNASLLALRLAFNADPSGNAASPLAAESTADVSATTAAYMLNAGTDATSQAAAKAATAYYTTAVANVSSVGDLLSDPKLVSYIEQAYNVPTNTSITTLQNILTSDVTDPKSTANGLGSNYNQLAAAFNFTSTGLISQQTSGVQSKSQLNAVNSAYLDNELETQAGQENPGIQLALYFDVNASKITSAYDILADKQLTQVFQTMMGQTADSSGSDIDNQANTISNQFDLSKMKDPTYVSSLVERFSILYDLNPPASTALDTTVSLFSGSNKPLDVTSLFGPPTTTG